MKKLFKVISIFGVVLASFLVVSSQTSPSKMKVEAVNELFTLDPIPTVDHEVAGNNIRNVATSDDYIASVSDQSVDVVNLTGDITLTGGMGLSVTRDLRINGNGNVLTIPGNASFGPADSTGTPARQGTHLILETNTGTLHIQNITINRATQGASQNSFISVINDSNQNWDVILENLTMNFSTNLWRSLVMARPNVVNTASVFLRGNVSTGASDGSTQGFASNNFRINNKYVVESNANVNFVTRDNNIIDASAGGAYQAYFAPGSTTTMYTPTGTGTTNLGVVSQATTSVVATVLTDTPPVLTVPNFTEIKLNQAFDSMAGVKAIDKEDGDITSNIKVTNPVLIHTTGIYTVKYEVIDSDNNKVTAIQTVLVNSGEYAYKDGFIIKASNVRIALSNANISNQQLIELAKVQVFDVLQQKWGLILR